MHEQRNLRVQRGNMTFSVTDVQWHRRSPSLIATSAPNASIIIWDLARRGAGKPLQVQVWKQGMGNHQRVAYRIDWSPHDDNTLLTASQDMTAKLWDQWIAEL